MSRKKSTIPIADVTNFVRHLRFEALALAILMAVLLYQTDASMWWLVIGFPLIDLCMIGYAFGPKIGALTYNLAHNATIPTLLIVAGLIFQAESVSVIGFVWTFHTAVDRVLGYGLKHQHSFKETHMGKIGE